MFSLVFSLLAVSSAWLIPQNIEELTGQALIDLLNSQQKFFKAELSKYTMDHMKAKAMREEFTKNIDNVTIKGDVSLRRSSIPESFDARSKWSSCPTIGAIYDQSTCGSCWAFASAEVMSDRSCIFTSKSIVLSPGDILSCCTSCGSCDGGYPLRAFNYWIENGVCTGGPYESKGDCKPYQLAPCEENCHSSRTPACENACQKGYSTPYQLDKRYGSQSYILSNSTAVIQKEIMENGPVATCFRLYEDFYHYKSGIYVHTAGKALGGHCVKVIGWGTENGIPYWLAANSWNTTFGEDGFFRIARETAGVDFDNEMTAVLPKV